jgi:D-beta-D-heptose 7-phosphate kinase / D-beta-D-heptose 1-phosphate adenosyltransferase
VRLVVVGDALLDRDLEGRAGRLSPDAPVPVLEDCAEHCRPGGAGLAAVLAARDGTDVELVTGLAGDPDGLALRALLDLPVHAAPLAGGTAVKTRVRAGGQSLLRLDRGAPGPVGELPAGAFAALERADAVLVSDYGRGLTAVPALREALARAARRVPVCWDPHPRGGEPVQGCRLATPNLSEASGYAGRALDPASPAEVGAAAVGLAARWGAGAVAVTLGGRGAVLGGGAGAPLVVPAPGVAAGDTCGAGDRFAVTAATLLGTGRLPSQAVAAAVDAAAAFVAAGAAAGLRANAAGRAAGDGIELARRVRAAGGTVVATGGCFDLLHAGHVRLLAAARRLGDCLVVCVNSDRSVRRLKGPGRPVVGQDDRAAVLAALSTVDAIVVFEEDDPTAVLRRIRPHLWVKGGDYAGLPLPEEPVLAGWGGRVVLLPYLDGRSTSGLIERVTNAEGS